MKNLFASLASRLLFYTWLLGLLCQHLLLQQSLGICDFFFLFETRSCYLFMQPSLALHSKILPQPPSQWWNYRQLLLYSVSAHVSKCLLINPLCAEDIMAGYGLGTRNYTMYFYQMKTILQKQINKINAICGT